VDDNKLSADKCMELYNILASAPQLKGFTFANIAKMYDYDSNEYSKFKENMKPIKQLRIMS
jgi:hypothetical protein